MHLERKSISKTEVTQWPNLRMGGLRAYLSEGSSSSDGEPHHKYTDSNSWLSLLLLLLLLSLLLSNNDNY